MNSGGQDERKINVTCGLSVATFKMNFPFLSQIHMYNDSFSSLKKIRKLIKKTIHFFLNTISNFIKDQQYIN